MARRKGPMVQMVIGFGVAALAILALLFADLSDGAHTVTLILLALGVGVGSIGIGNSFRSR